MAQKKQERVKPRPVTTRHRIEARLARVFKWIAKLDEEIREHRLAISAIKSPLRMVKLGLKQPLSKANMEQLLAGLHVAGIKHHGLPSEEDPRHPESPEWLRHGQADDLSDVVEDEEFVKALQGVGSVLRARQEDAVVGIDYLMKERRELSEFRKKFRNLLRDRSAGVKAAFERVAKGGDQPRWFYIKGRDEARQ